MSEMQKTTVYIEKDVLKELKIKCVTEEKSVSAFIRECIKKELKNSLKE